MAILKPIEQDDGIVTNYHRVASVENVVNEHNSIFVFSYVNEASRNKEKEGAENIYKQAITYEIDYIENLTVTGAYDFLKTLDTFSDAGDV